MNPQTNGAESKVSAWNRSSKGAVFFAQSSSVGRYWERVGRLLLIVVISWMLSACALIDTVASIFFYERPERVWIRQKQESKNLMVLVHGFNSSNKNAWGELPNLLKDDPAFSSFDILLFGYPTNVCGDLKSIQNEGKYLASFLNDTIPRYGSDGKTGQGSVLLVGHSMGGLVILNSLFKLKDDYPAVLYQSDLAVATFGTPFGGVKEASFLPSLFCENRKTVEMQVLSDELYGVRKNWEKFNKGRGISAVDLYVYFGRGDNFVPEPSACDIQAPCEAVDGKHFDMVKPETREHLTYSKILRIIKRPKITLHWEISPINAEVDGLEHGELKALWTDIYWHKSKGWLGGIIEGGGGGGDVGRGLVLRTIDRGASWKRIPQENLASGTGKFRWAPCASDEPKESCERHYLYRWKDVGPVTALAFYKPVGQEKLLGILASTTGLYGSEDDGEHWHRMTPPPDGPGGYAHFGNFATIEGFHEMYAVGWQGIAHGIPDVAGQQGQWFLELPSFSFAIASVFVGPDREIWAVGHGPNYGERHYKGAVYYKAPRSNKWTLLALPGINLEFDQSFSDILLTDYSTAVIIGQRGLILRGLRQDSTGWIWQQVQSPTTQDLNSITYQDGTIWIVGSSGTILCSRDNGMTWSVLPLIVEGTGKVKNNLRRLKFFGETGWIVGDTIVLKGSPMR